MSDLKRLDVSDTVEDDPIETIKFSVLPLKNELARLSESLRTLE